MRAFTPSLAVATAAVLVACQGTGTTAASPAPSSGSVKNVAFRPLMAEPQELVESLHGYKVSDPYRTLEADETAAPWVASQNEATKRYLAATTVDAEAATRRLDELSRVGGASSVRIRGDVSFYAKRIGDQEQSILYVRKGEEEKALVDPAALDPTGKTALDWYYPSPSGKLIAYGLSKDGTENSVLHILEVETGKLLDDRIPNTRHASIAWLPDESGFYYTRYPEGDRYNRHVYSHQLGADPKEDPYVFGRDLDRTDWTTVDLSKDGSKLLVLVSKGWSVSEVWVLDRKSGKFANVLPASLKALFSPAFDGNELVVLTNHEAPRFKLVRVDPKRPQPKAWKTLIAEGAWPIETFELMKDRIAVVRLVKAVSKLEFYDRTGRNEGSVVLPDLGSITNLDAESDGTRLAFGFGSFLKPVGVYQLQLPSLDVAELATVPAPDTSDFVVEQFDYPSYDGTRVPMFLMRHKNTRTDGRNATLLTGYGGFNVSITPRFSPMALHWVEAGGVYAVANLRGGAELGEEWHEAGRLANKHQVFRDFEYAMRHLIRIGYTRPDKLAITGGSNGGLLMGAMMTQAPELFAAAVGRVGLYDMIRYHKFPPAELWVDEYGSSDDPDQVGFLYGYSPYHNVHDGVRYPAFLGLTAKADTRVTWVHTAKFVARLQRANASEEPILFHMEEKAGHGQGKGRSDRVAEEVMMFQFVASELGLGGQGPADIQAAR